MDERKPPNATYGLYEGCPGCLGCPQECAETWSDHSFGGFILPKIHTGASIMAIGDEPDLAEFKRGEVFSGMTGYWWHRVLRMIQVSPSKFSLANTISCLPPKDWKKSKVDANTTKVHCQQYVRRLLETYKPDVVLALGELPTNLFLGDGALVQTHAPRRGYVFEEAFGKWSGLVVPSVHPRLLGKGKAAWTPLLMHDIHTALAVQRTGKPAWKDYKPYYVEYPTNADIDEFESRAKRYFEGCEDLKKMFTCDIETEESGRKEEEDYDDITDAEITRVSFAYRPGYAITIPFKPEFFAAIQRLLDLPSTYIVYWKWDFDHPRLLAKGFKITQTILDGMELWHYYKTALPKSLGSVTPNLCPHFAEWKSLFGVDLAFYSCVDSDAAISNVYEMFEKMPANQLQAFLRHWVEIRPINHAMHVKGALIDLDKQDALRTTLNTDMFGVNESVQTLIPEHIKPFTFYKMVPIAFRCRKCAGKGYTTKQRTKMGPCEECESTGRITSSTIDRDSIIDSITDICLTCKGRGKYSHKLPLEIHPCIECDQMGHLPDKIPEPWTHEVGGRTGCFEETSETKYGADGLPRKTWGFKQKFLPTSPYHVADYLRDNGYPVPINYHTEKETTDVKALTELMHKHKKDKVLPLIVEYRQIKKMLGQYVDGYVPWEDGRIHTTFGQKATNLRFNSVRPNVQNVIQKGKYAQLYRQQFVPKPGHVLAELDHSGAEAQIVGFYANDPDYIRIAKLSIHGILASYVLVNEGVWQNPIDLKWSDDDIRAAVNEIKKKFKPQYQRAKNCVHGSNYGAVPYKLFMEYRDAFPELKFAEEIQELYFGTIARGVKQWHHDTWEGAYKNRYIENVYGYRFDFWDVLSPNWYGDLEIDNRTGYWKLGKQAKDCLAFNPASTEAALMKDIMIWLGSNTDLLQWLIWMIHDSLVFELPYDNKLEGRLAVIEEAMARPVKLMDNLSIECGVDVGLNWGAVPENGSNPLGMQSLEELRAAA